MLAVDAASWRISVSSVGSISACTLEVDADACAERERRPRNLLVQLLVRLFEVATDMLGHPADAVRRRYRRGANREGDRVICRYTGVGV